MSTGPSTRSKAEAGGADLSAITKLITELRGEFKANFSTIDSKLDNIQISIGDQAQRLTAVEEGLNSQSDQLAVLEARCATLEDDYAKLKSRLVDAESRHRRSNIRILLLDEKISPGNGVLATDFFAEVLMTILGRDVLPEPPELDRAHRALTAKGPPGSKPRAVIVCLHRYKVKEAIIRAARKNRGSLTYMGKPVLIFEDYPPEVMEQRSSYRDVMSSLYQHGFKPSLLFPARLFITTKDGKRRQLHSPKDATDFLKSHARAASSPPPARGSSPAPRASRLPGSPPPSPSQPQPPDNGGEA